MPGLEPFIAGALVGPVAALPLVGKVRNLAYKVAEKRAQQQKPKARKTTKK